MIANSAGKMSVNDAAKAGHEAHKKGEESKK